MDHPKENLSTRVLVVDDDPAVLSLLESALGEAGYETERASSAAEALDRAVEFNPSFALVDIRLPGDMDGLDLCRHLRQDHGIDVLVITGFEREYGYVDAVFSGASDFVVKPIKIEELLLRCERVVETRRIRRARDRSIRELRLRAVTDTLTGLFTSAHLFHQLKAEISRSTRYSRKMSVCMLDVDGLKQINETYGRQEGDHVLAYLADTIRSVMREADEAFRYGGEEFVLILPETDGDSAVHLAERLHAETCEKSMPTESGDSILMNINLGVAQWQADEDEKTLLKRVETAKSRGKKTGKIL